MDARKAIVLSSIYARVKSSKANKSPAQSAIFNGIFLVSILKMKIGSKN